MNISLGWDFASMPGVVITRTLLDVVAELLVHFRLRMLAEHASPAPRNNPTAIENTSTLLSYSDLRESVGSIRSYHKTRKGRAREGQREGVEGHRHIGVRVALGAQPGDLVRLVLRQGLLLSVAGIAL